MIFLWHALQCAIDNGAGFGAGDGARRTRAMDGLAERFQAELGPDIRFYATGNLPRTIREACRTPIEYREYLITDGLYRIWQKNRKG